MSKQVVFELPDDFPEEQVDLLQGFIEFLTQRTQKQKGKEGKKQISIPTVKADVFLRHAGIISVGGDAVKDSEYYEQ